MTIAAKIINSKAIDAKTFDPKTACASALAGGPSTWLAGAIPDLPTPFDADNRIDLAALEALCRRHIAAGCAALVVADLAGECPTLTLSEHREVIAAAARAAQGQLAVIAGASSNATAHAIDLARQAEAAGADAVIATAPYYNKPMQEGVFQHFCAIADATRLPILLADAPNRTARGIADETVVRLAASRRFIGLKDAALDLGRPRRLRPRVGAGFRLLGGDDATAQGYLAQGGDGVISQLANVICALGTSPVAHRSGARGIVDARMMTLATSLAEDGAPAALKYALSLLGAMSPAVRLPLVDLPEAAKAVIRAAVNDLSRMTATSALSPFVVHAR